MGRPPATYQTVDATRFTHPTASHPAAPAAMQVAPPGQRWLMICGAVAAAIVVAFVIARLVRGALHDGHPAVATGTAIVAPRATPAPGAKAGSGASAKPAATHPVAQAAVPVGSAADPVGGAADPGDSLKPEDEGEAVAGGTPIVGSGPCRFTVATTPAGSIVRIDDQSMGPSPLTIDGTCDKHKIEVSHARYQNATKWVTLVADKPQEVDISLPRPVHAVTVLSVPPGAELSIDGHRAGTTPMVVQMMGFATVNLTFTKAGFQSVTKKVYSKLPQDRVFVKLLR